MNTGRTAMVLSVVDVLNLASVTAGFAGGILFYLGSLGVPREMESGKVNTDPEVRLKRKRRLQNVAGIASVFIVLIFQATALLIAFF